MNSAIIVTSVTVTWLDLHNRLHGLNYSDIVHLYALFRAGYVPDMISTALTDPTVVLSLLSKNGAQALLHDPGVNFGRELPTYTPVDISLVSRDHLPLPEVTHNGPEDVAFINYTSGSTSDGMPKTVPCTHKWIATIYEAFESIYNPAPEGCPQDVFNLPGSVNHPSGLHGLLFLTVRKSTKVDYSHY